MLPEHTISKELPSMLRWRAGHHLFFVLIQNMIIVFNAFAEAIETNNLAEAEAALEKATKLVKASTISMYFASDFLPEEYENIVRLSMAPPYLEIGLSGMMFSDHRHLIRFLTQLKPVFNNLPPAIQPIHQTFIDAMEATYEAHKQVCTEFVGNKPSLYTEKSSIEILDQFKCNRLQIITPDK